MESSSVLTALMKKYRIVVIGSNIEDSMEWHINQTLIQLGHTSFLVPLYTGKGLFHKGQLYLNHFDQLPDFFINLLYKRIIEKSPEILIVCRRDFPPKIIAKVKSEGIKTIHINPDAITNFERQAIFAEDYDHYFVKCRRIHKFMHDHLKLRVHKYLECYNDEHLVSKYHHKLEAENNEDISIMMYGSYYPYKWRMIDELQQKGLEFALFGFKGYFFPKNLEQYWKSKFVVGPEKADKIFGSKIVFNNLAYSEIHSLNCRFFEVIGAGGVQVVNHVDDLVEIYDKEFIKHISFETTDEAFGKISKLLNSSSLRVELSEYNKTLAKRFTYKKFLIKLFEIIS